MTIPTHEPFKIEIKNRIWNTLLATGLVSEPIGSAEYACFLSEFSCKGNNMLWSPSDGKVMKLRSTLNGFSIKVELGETKQLHKVVSMANMVLELIYADYAKEH